MKLNVIENNRWSLLVKTNYPILFKELGNWEIKFFFAIIFWWIGKEYSHTSQTLSMTFNKLGLFDM